MRLFFFVGGGVLVDDVVVVVVVIIDFCFVIQIILYVDLRLLLMEVEFVWVVVGGGGGQTQLC